MSRVDDGTTLIVLVHVDLDDTQIQAHNEVEKSKNKNGSGRIVMTKVFICLVVFALLPVMAHAGPILLTTDGSTVFQQTTNSPCVIGNPSCNQGGFVYNSWTSTPGGGQGSTYDLLSPVYLVGAGIVDPNTIPTAFSIGIDINFSAGWEEEKLVFFKTLICADDTGSSCSVDNPNSYLGPTTTIFQRNGNGYSDAVLSGFTLTSGDFVKFEASVSNDTDGMEQFFLIPAGTEPIPEPATTALVGGGLLALTSMLRRRKRS